MNIRWITCLVLLPLSVQPARGQPPQPPPVPTTKLLLQPSAPIEPVLRYALLPKLTEITFGNAAQQYYRAFTPELQFALSHDRKVYDRLMGIAEKPLRELIAADLDGLDWVRNNNMLREVDRAARRPYCDWELLDRSRQDGIGLLLPDVQDLRKVAQELKVRAKLELSKNDFAAANRTLATGFAMSRHIAAGPTLIHGLVAAAVATQLLEVVDDWIDRPGSPNLYWALTDLPRPLIDLRSGLEGERFTIENMFPGFREAIADPKKDLPPSNAENDKKMLGVVTALGGDEPDSQVPAKLFGIMIAARHYPDAKRWLTSTGRPAAQVEAMPVLPVLMMYEVHNYDAGYDEMRKVMNLPYTDSVPFLAKLEQRSRQDRRDHMYVLASLLLPAVSHVVHAPLRVDRRIAVLRCIEAMRLYAAAHDNRWPNKLADITEVPVPLDPATGKAFEYERTGDKAIFTAPAYDARHNIVRYELTLGQTKGGK